MFTGLYNFGAKIEGNLLDSVSKLDYWESYVMRIIFLFIMITHTPFTFFLGKESALLLAVLVYTALKKKEENGQYDQIQDENSQDSDSYTDKSGLVDINEGHTKLNIRNSSIRNRSKSYGVFVVDELVQRCSESQMSLAIPFSKRSMRFTEVDENTPNLDFENAAAHELLPDSIYYTVTIILFSAVVATACMINDVEIVIKFVGSLGNATLNFFIPGITYFLILRKNKGEKTPAWKLYCALLLAIYSGCLALI